MSMQMCPFWALPDTCPRAASPSLRSLEQLLLPTSGSCMFFLPLGREISSTGSRILRREVGQHPGGVWTCSYWLKGREGVRRVHKCAPLPSFVTSLLAV